MSLARGGNRNVQNLETSGSGGADGVPINPTKVTISGGSDDTGALSVFDADNNLIFNVNTVTDLVTINGDLFVNGTATFVETVIEEFKSPMIELNTGEVAGSDVRDIGFFGGYTPVLTTFYCGLVRDASDNTFKFFTDNPTEPNLTVDSINTYLADAALKTLNMIGDINMKSGLFTISRGSGANDSVTFASSGSGSMIFNVGGGTMFNFNTVAASIAVPFSLVAGSATATALNFGTAGTGFYGDSTNLRFSTGGSLRLTIGSSSIVSTLALSLPNSGSAAATVLNFGTAGTGIYGDSTTVRFATSDTLRFTINGSAITSTLPYVAPAGSVGATSFNFGTAGTGIYGDATSVRFAIAGVNVVTLTSTGISTTGTYQKNGTTILDSASTILAVGVSAVASVTIGTNLVGVGENALGTVSTTSNSTAVGYNAARLITGGDVTAVGSGVLGVAAVATGSSAFGSTAARVNTSIRISAFGFESAYNNTDALNQTVFGYRAGYSQTSIAGGSGYTSAFGYSALANATGSYNSGFGDSVGASLTTGQFNVLIGAGSDVDVGARSNVIVLGRGAVSRAFDNSVTIGFGTTPITRVFIEGINNNLIGSPVGYVSCDGDGMIGYSAIPTISTIALEDGTLTSPSLSFVNNSNLGIYRPSANTMGFVSNNALSMSISDTAITSTIPIVLPSSGAAATTVLNFGTAGTGIYGTSTSILFATGGTLRFTVDIANITSTLAFLAPAGTVSLPAYSFSGDPNTGIYNISADNLGFSTNATLRLTISTTTITSTLPYYAPSGSASVPSYTFSTDIDTGMFRNLNASSSSMLSFAIDGVERVVFSPNSTQNYNSQPMGFLTIIGDSPNGNHIVCRSSTTAAKQFQCGLSTSNHGYILAIEQGVGFLPLNVETSQIRFVNTSSAGTPAYSFSGDPNTGMYNISADNLGFSTNATLRLTIDTTNVTSTLPIVIPTGTAALPGLAFSADLNTGIFSIAGDNIGITTAGNQKVNVNTTYMQVNLPIIVPTGSAAAPTYSFSSDTNTGIYNPSADNLAFSAGGTLRFTIDTANITSTLAFLAPAGTVSLPAYSFSGDPNTGIYNSSADNLAFSTNATLRLTISTTGIISTLPYIAPLGAVGTPSFTFTGDANTGIYSSTADTIDFATAGVNRLSLSTTLISTVPLQFNGSVSGSVTLQAPSTITTYTLTLPTAQGAANSYLSNNGSGVLSFVTTLTPALLGIGDGSVGSPSLYFTSTPTTGLYLAGVNTLGITTNGVLRLSVSTAAITSTLPISAPAGSNAATSFNFGTAGTGIYGSSTQTFFATSTVLRLTIDTANITSTLAFLGPAGTVSLPAYSFSGDPNTGIYNSAADTLDFATNGINRLSISTSSLISTVPLQLNGSVSGSVTLQAPGTITTYSLTLPTAQGAANSYLSNNGSGVLSFVTTLTPALLGLANGSVGSPSLYFTSATTTGIYYAGVATLGITTNSTLRFSVSTTNITSTLTFLAPVGTAALPAYSFSDNANAGMYNISTDNLGFSTNSTLRLTISTTNITSALAFLAPAGSASLPAYSFSGDPNTGIYSAAGADTINFSAAGTLRFTIATTGITSTLPYIAPLGAVGTPSYTFTGDENTGMYSSGADTINFATAGSLMFIVTTTGVGVRSTAVLASVQGDLTIGSTGTTVAINMNTSSTGISQIITQYGTGVYNAATTRNNAVWQWGLRTNVAGVTDINDRIAVGRAGVSGGDLSVFRDGAVGVNTAVAPTGNYSGSILYAVGQIGTTTTFIGALSNATTPTFSFAGDANTGMYSSGADSIDFSAGGTLRFTISTANITSTLAFLGPAGTAALPAYSFSGDPNTGIYNISADNLGFSTNATLRLTISTTSITSTLPYYAIAGSVSAPSYTFSTSTDTGIYQTSNQLNFACTGFNAGFFRNTSVSGYALQVIANRARTVDGNTLFRLTTNEGSNMLETTMVYYGTALANWRLEFGVSQNSVGYIDLNLACRQILTSNTTNTAALPIYSFLGDPNTGIYNPSADNLGFSTNSTLRLTISTTGITSTLPYVAPAGSAAATSLNFGTAGTGIYGTSTTILHSTSGVLRLTVDTAAITSTLPYVAPVGSAAATSFNFGTDGTGYYSVSATNLSASISGVQSSALDYLTGLTVNSGINTVVLTSNTVSSVGISSSVCSNDGSYLVNANWVVSSFRGSVFVLTNSSNTWSLQTTLVPTNYVSGSAAFGRNSVGLSADATVLAFGGSEFNANAGGIWIYTRSGTTWTQRTDALVGTGSGGRRGFAVSLSKNGRTAVSGCINDPSGVQIWEGEGSSWTQLGYFSGSGATGSAEMGFSVDISSDANTVVFGGQADNSGLGAAWVFVRSNNTYTQLGSKLVPTDNTGNAAFGRTISISPSGNTFAAGGIQDNAALGAVWVFVKSGSSYIQDGTKLAPSTTGTQIGTTVFMVDDNNLLFGCAAGTNTAWKYTKVGGVWTLQFVVVITSTVSGICGTPNNSQIMLTNDSGTLRSVYLKSGNILAGTQISNIGNYLGYPGSSWQTTYGSNLDSGNSGVYFPAIYEIALSAGGTRAFYATETYSQIDQPTYFILGTVSTPSITFVGDTNTGIYSSAADTIDFTTSATNRLKISTTAVTSTLPLQFNGSVSGSVTLQAPGTITTYSLTLPTTQGSANSYLSNNGSGVLSFVTTLTPTSLGIGDGSVGSPSLYFTSTPTTGIYLAGVNTMGITTNGILQLRVSTAAITSTLPYVAPVGSNIATSFNFGTAGTGIYGSSTQIFFATSTGLRLTVDTVNITSTLAFLGPAGSASLPAYSFSGDSNTGIYNISADNLGFSTNATLRLTIATTAITSTLPIIIPTGSAGAPSITFTGDTDTGIYSGGDGNINFSVNTVNYGTFNSTFGLDLYGMGYRGLRFNTGNSQGFVGANFAISDISDCTVMSQNWNIFANTIPNTGGSTSAIASGLGDVKFLTGAVNTVPTIRLTISTTAITSTLPIIIPTGSSSAPSIRFDSDTGMYSSGDGNVNFSTNSTLRLTISTTAITCALNLLPSVNATYTLGNTSFRWNECWVTAGAFNTSDLRLKEEIEITNLGLEFIMALRPVKYKWKPDETGIHNRKFHGFIAQEVKQVLDEMKIDTQDFAGYADGLIRDGVDIQALRYTEFIAPLTRAVQQLKGMIDTQQFEIGQVEANRVELENQLNVMTSKFNNLKNLLVSKNLATQEEIDVL